MIRANLKAGAQGVVGSLTAVANGTITVPNSAGAQAVSIVANNSQSASYTLQLSPKSGEYDSILIEAKGVSTSSDRYGCIVVPKSDSDLVLTCSYNGTVSIPEIKYTITP